MREPITSLYDDEPEDDGRGALLWTAGAMVAGFLGAVTGVALYAVWLSWL